MEDKKPSVTADYQGPDPDAAPVAYATCDRLGCAEEPKWRPVLLLVPSRGYTGPPLRVELAINICNEHREQVLDVYINEELWLEIINGIKTAKPNSVLPHRLSTRVEYVAITECKCETPMGDSKMTCMTCSHPVPKVH
jgi:hypothetical protein